ncbi:hypothetical protein HAHE_32930 [Haloferula helveola]|uniref:Transposase n=1 Tax=Haloferula helveola TaxID=490095 RepID=A0ABN6HDY9_9BACT|nr:hypothetical protein HAHE_32930 [Haloferula helveola]
MARSSKFFVSQSNSRCEYSAIDSSSHLPVPSRASAEDADNAATDPSESWIQDRRLMEQLLSEDGMIHPLPGSKAWVKQARTVP